jgi:hypothetical protein
MGGVRGVRSLDLLLEEVRIERDLQLRHFDALDAKAGIVLGFAGALVALNSSPGSVLVGAGRFFGVGSGLAALTTFWPRRYWNIDLASFRDRYLAAEPGFAKLRLLDTQIEMARLGTAVLDQKATRLKIAMGALSVAVLLTASGLGLH